MSRVMLVGDYEENSQLVVHLEGLDYEVLVEKDGEEALRNLNLVDLVLLDLNSINYKRTITPSKIGCGLALLQDIREKTNTKMIVIYNVHREADENAIKSFIRIFTCEGSLEGLYLQSDLERELQRTLGNLQ